MFILKNLLKNNFKTKCYKFLPIAFCLLPLLSFGQSKINLFLNLNGSYYKNPAIESPLKEFKETHRLDLSPEFIVEYNFDSIQSIGLGASRNSIGTHIYLQSKTYEFYKYDYYLRAPLLCFPAYYKYKIINTKAKKVDLIFGVQYFINLTSGTFTEYSEYKDTLINEYHNDSALVKYFNANCFGPYVGITYRINNLVSLRATFTSALKPLLLIKAYYSTAPKQFPNGNIYYDNATRINLGISFNLNSILHRRRR